MCLSVFLFIVKQKKKCQHLNTVDFDDSNKKKNLKNLKEKTNVDLETDFHFMMRVFVNLYIVLMFRHVSFRPF